MFGTEIYIDITDTIEHSSLVGNLKNRHDATMCLGDVLIMFWSCVGDVWAMLLYCLGIYVATLSMSYFAGPVVLCSSVHWGPRAS